MVLSIYEKQRILFYYGCGLTPSQYVQHFGWRTCTQLGGLWHASYGGLSLAERLPLDDVYSAITLGKWGNITERQASQGIVMLQQVNELVWALWIAIPALNCLHAVCKEAGKEYI